MKKYFATFFVIALILAMALCGYSKKTENNRTEGTKNTAAQTEIPNLQVRKQKPPSPAAHRPRNRTPLWHRQTMFLWCR